MKHSKITLLASVGMLALGLAGTADAGRLDVVLNGKSFHVNSDRDWNESNWGLGFEYEFNPESRWVKLALGNGFIDSDEQMSYMAGGGIKRRFRLPIGDRRFFFDVGAIGFVMKRHDVNGNAPFPGILPAFSFGTSRVALNATYLPGGLADRVTNVRFTDPNLDGVAFLQLKFTPEFLGFRPD